MLYTELFRDVEDGDIVGNIDAFIEALEDGRIAEEWDKLNKLAIQQLWEQRLS